MKFASLSETPFEAVNKSEETNVKSIDRIFDINTIFNVGVSNSVYTGDGTVYVLGVRGLSLKSDSILYAKYNLSINECKIIEKGRRLPFGDQLGAVFTGEDILIFGGQVYESSHDSNKIYRLDLESEKLKELEVNLPENITDENPHFSVRSVWAEDRAILFFEKGAYAFYPSNNTFKQYELEYPEDFFSGLHDRSIVYAEGSVYFFNQDKIYCFDTEKRTLKELQTELPTNHPDAWRRSAVYTGEEIYIIGGGGFHHEIIDEIIRFDPETKETELMNTRLPVRLHGCNPVCDGEYIYILGGRKKTGVADSYKDGDDVSSNDTFGVEMNVIWRYNYQDLPSNEDYPGIKYDYSTEYTTYGSLFVSIIITTLILIFKENKLK
ncbi:MAG: hypothetical protein ACOCSL_00590 [Thermoplasmatota archaeon]